MTWCKQKPYTTGHCMHMDSWNWGEITEIHSRGDEAINNPSLIIFAPHWGSWLCFPDIVTHVFFHVFSHLGQLRAVNTEYKLKMLNCQQLCFLLFSSLFFIVGEGSSVSAAKHTHTFHVVTSLIKLLSHPCGMMYICTERIKNRCSCYQNSSKPSQHSVRYEVICYTQPNDRPLHPNTNKRYCGVPLWVCMM